ncbi:hypothetical protein Dimus_001859, partial [Dionaea muscipula]
MMMKMLSRQMEEKDEAFEHAVRVEQAGEGRAGGGGGSGAEQAWVKLRRAGGDGGNVTERAGQRGKW